MRPSDLGELRSTTRWSEPMDLLDRLLSVAIVGLLAAIAVKLVTGAPIRSFEVRDVGPILGAGGLAFWVFGPVRGANYIGELGVLRVRTHRLATERVGFLFHQAASVRVELERIVSDGIGQLYMHTHVTVTWRDEGGAPVFALTVTVREPDQVEDWSVRNELDPLALAGLPPHHPAMFAFQAKHAFEEYLERTRGPYR